MELDLENMSLKDLRQLQKTISRHIDNYEARQKEKAAQAAQQAAAEYGFSLKDLAGHEKAKAKVAPKYAHPEDKAMTWTGRGRQPRWVKEHLDAGGSLDDVLI